MGLEISQPPNYPSCPQSQIAISRLNLPTGLNSLLSPAHLVIMSHLNSWEDDPSAQQDERLARQAQQQLNMNPAQAQPVFQPGVQSFQPGAQSFTPGAQSFQPGQAYGSSYGYQQPGQQQYYQQQQQQGYYSQYGGQQAQNQFQQYGGGFTQGYNQTQGYGKTY